jgi:hypothetical protein
MAKCEVVLVGEKDEGDYDEVYAQWYFCPKCRQHGLLRSHLFCPYCGVGLAWEEKK